MHAADRSSSTCGPPRSQRARGPTTSLVLQRRLMSLSSSSTHPPDVDAASCQPIWPSCSSARRPTSGCSPARHSTGPEDRDLRSVRRRCARLGGARACGLARRCGSSAVRGSSDEGGSASGQTRRKPSARRRGAGGATASSVSRPSRSRRADRRCTRRRRQVGDGRRASGVSPHWRLKGIGAVRGRLAHDAHSPTLLVHGGPRPGGLAPRGSDTRFTCRSSCIGRAASLRTDALAQRDEAGERQRPGLSRPRLCRRSRSPSPSYSATAVTCFEGFARPLKREQQVRADRIRVDLPFLRVPTGRLQRSAVGRSRPRRCSSTGQPRPPFGGPRFQVVTMMARRVSGSK